MERGLYTDNSDERRIGLLSDRRCNCADVRWYNLRVILRRSVVEPRNAQLVLVSPERGLSVVRSVLWWREQDAKRQRASYELEGDFEDG